MEALCARRENVSPTNRQNVIPELSSALATPSNRKEAPRRRRTPSQGNPNPKGTRLSHPTSQGDIPAKCATQCFGTLSGKAAGKIGNADDKAIGSHGIRGKERQTGLEPTVKLGR